MTIEALEYLNNELSDLLPYEFMEWNSDLQFPFFVGEYTEPEPVNEDGYLESTMVLTGTTNTSFLDLETAKDTIRKHFTAEGKEQILESGSGIVVSYAGAFAIPSEDETIHRIQINLRIQEWRVDNNE